MELKQLRQFLAVAETESFSKGAQRAFVSQPALSSAIAKLEAEFDVKLFTRAKRRATLTPEGRLLLQSARTVMEECGRIKRDLRRLRTREAIRIGVINTLSVDLLVRLVERFRIENPEVFLDVIDGPVPEIGRSMAAGRLDVAFTAAADMDGGPAVEMDAVLFSEPYVVAIPPGHRLGGRQAITVSDLDGEHFVARTHCEYRQVLAAILKEKGVRLKVAYRTDQDDRALALVRAGLGVAIVPDHYAAPGVAKLRFSEQTFSRTVGLCWKREPQRRCVERFVEFCRTDNWR